MKIVVEIVTRLARSPDNKQSIESVLYNSFSSPRPGNRPQSYRPGDLGGRTQGTAAASALQGTSAFLKKPEDWSACGGHSPTH